MSTYFLNLKSDLRCNSWCCRIEKQLKKRFPIGAQISQHTIVSDFEKQKYPERQVQKVLATMIRRGELQHRMQRKMLYRIK